ncbi:class I SAM-dependent methyltransferase [Saccharothrix yanglingensis]|uniref:class I SAM-dependent methyltransferase n=1 Tax=Saccharothrix yanglingensis TaxID=659496 RepID=UPI0027D2390A|nr:class I SAM-dependent methyltransferase [Saccharothrix yanglingensis]
MRTVEELPDLLDGLFERDAGEARWDRFYAARARPVPFFAAKPDENPVARLPDLSRGRALDLGCGPGRNAVHRAHEAAADVRFHVGDVLTATSEGPYDLVYDSGLFHHLPPHRRISYLALLDRVLAPGGHVGPVAFAAGERGSERPDTDLCRTPPSTAGRRTRRSRRGRSSRPSRRSSCAG